MTPASTASPTGPDTELASRDGFSIPVFINPEWHTEARCLPNCVTDEHPARHEPVLSGEFLQSRCDVTFVHCEDAPVLREVAQP